MKKITALLGSLALSTYLFAQAAPVAEVTQEDIKLQNEVSDASTQDITPKSVEDFFEEFADSYNIDYGITDDRGRTFFTGKANVAVSDTDPQFAQALQVAYERAIVNMQGEFVRSTLKELVTETESEMFNDGSTNARQFEELPKGGTMKQVFDKLTQLAGAKLDSALKNLGVDVTGLTEERKKVILKDSFTRKVVLKGSQSMSGLVPVQTVVTQKRGSYQVGVIATISNKTTQIARDMSLGRKSIIKGNGGKKIAEYLPQEKAGFLNEYGIRLFYDENGAPVILSYGNWGFVPDSKGGKTNRLEDLAQKTATNLADAAIVEFMGINVAIDNNTITGDSYEETLKESFNVTTNTKDLTEEDFTNVISKVSEKIKTKAKGSIRGIRTIKKWTHTAENGVEHVGVVRVYTYDNLENTNQMLKNMSKPSNASSTGATQGAKSGGAKIERKSNVVNSIDDF